MITITRMIRKTIVLLLFTFTLSVNGQCWKTVSSGADFCVALKEDGTLWAWGHNDSGQLGIGSSEDKDLPVQIGIDSDWDSISAGSGFAVALKTDGTVWVWGRNDFGLGTGAGNQSNIPIQVGTDTDWKFINAGGAHCFAIKTNGALWAWGRNNFGQLGNGTFSHANVPVQVGSDTNWKMITAGTFHTLGVKTDHTLWSWGYNFHGQLGLGTAGFGTEVNTPTPIASIPANEWKSIATGGRHSLAVTAEGSLWVWGNNNDFALGLNDGSAYRSFPTRIDQTNHWKAVAAGTNNTFAVKTDYTLWAWGENTDGQLGDGSSISRAAPVQIAAADNWMAVDGGLQHAAFLKGTEVFTAGRNAYGELGIGSFVPHNTLQFVACPGSLGVEENTALPFVAYPNPVKGTLFLQQDRIKIDRIQIVDGSERIVLSQTDCGSVIDVNHLSAGWYVLRVSSGKDTYCLKLMKI